MRGIFEYIPLNDDKIPIGKPSTGGFPFDEIKDFDNVAILVPEPYIVLDFDTADDAEIMLQIVEGLDLKCNVLKTTRGYHFWFKSDTPWKNFTKTRLAIGLHADCKSWGKTSYTVIKQHGKWREWVRTTDEIQPVPKWLSPVSASKDYSFKGMVDGSGRNNALFEYILILQRKGFTKDEVIDTLNVINDYVFDEPLSCEDMEKITREDAFLSDSEVAVQSFLDEDGKIVHNLFGDELIRQYNIVTVNDNIYIYSNGYYQRDERLVEQAMIEICPSIKSHMRFEILSYIRIKTHYKMGSLDPESQYTINIKNGRLNVLTREISEHSPEHIEFAREPVIYDPDAYDVHVDKMLNRTFCNDIEVRMLFEEMLGYCLTKNTKYQKGFMFYGSGSNGKSTVLDMIREFLGRDNVSSIELDKLTERFVTPELENKLANIGDDSNNVQLKDTGTIKKLFTGEGVQVDRKNQQPFTLYNYAKMMFSVNELPYSSDKTDGFYRRFEIIPFNAKFSSSDPDYDPFIEQKVTTENAKSYLLNIALEGLDRLTKNGEFTEPKCVQRAKDEYRTINSSVLTWIHEESLDVDYLCSKHINELYSEYCDYCTLAGVRNKTSRPNFTKEIKSEFNLDNPNIRLNGVQGRAFQKKGE